MQPAQAQIADALVANVLIENAIHPLAHVLVEHAARANMKCAAAGIRALGGCRPQQDTKKWVSCWEGAQYKFSCWGVPHPQGRVWGTTEVGPSFERGNYAHMARVEVGGNVQFSTPATCVMIW